MIFTINKIGDKILEIPCKEVDLKKIDNYFKNWDVTGYYSFKHFIECMIETARHHDAVGLAANQVGESLRIFIFRKDCSLNDTSELKNYKWEVAINPKILPYSGKAPAFTIDDIQEEGCLSVPKIVALVPRPNKIEVEYFNEKGEKINRTLTGLTARIFSHEQDHLDGILFLQKALKIQYVK